MLGACDFSGHADVGQRDTEMNVDRVGYGMFECKVEGENNQRTSRVRTFHAGNEPCDIISLAIVDSVADETFVPFSFSGLEKLLFISTWFPR